LYIGDRLQAPSYLSRVDHHWKIRARKQRIDIGKFSFGIGPLLTETSYLKGRSGLPTVKLIFSKRGLGKSKTVGEVKAIKSKK
jgi:hypothetical protein